MKDTKICVIGLGYVGLPLARLFSTKFETIGFDMNQRRVDALMTKSTTSCFKMPSRTTASVAPPTLRKSKSATSM